MIPARGEGWLLGVVVPPGGAEGGCAGQRLVGSVATAAAEEGGAGVVAFGRYFDGCAWAAAGRPAGMRNSSRRFRAVSAD